MDIVKLVSSIIDDLEEISPSTDRLGAPNWMNVGARKKCWRCGKQFGKELESGSDEGHHLIPKSEGGRKTSDNMALLCANCHKVVHRFYMPTSRIGKCRTRNTRECTRVIGKFKNGMIISQKLPKHDHSLHTCPKCSETATVVGVSEGYWNGEGMIVFLECTVCGLKFGELFIGTIKPPKISPISPLLLALEQGHSLAQKKNHPLPVELQSRVDAWMRTVREIIKDFRAERNSAARNAERSQMTKEAIVELLNEVRERHAARLKAMLPEAAKLTEDCKVRGLLSLF